MHAAVEERDLVWIDRYGYVCPAEQGKILRIEGIGEHDYYNPALCDFDGVKLLAFRMEQRESDWRNPKHYKPSIVFARQDSTGEWHLVARPPAFPMLEDPSFFVAEHDGKLQPVLSGVRVTNAEPGMFVPNTEFYTGASLLTLSRAPFANIGGMKDVRLVQLPDKRFLLCRRPRGGRYGNGRITLHIIDELETLNQLHAIDLPILAVLDSHFEHDWVGANNLYVLRNAGGEAYIGILGHLGLTDHGSDKHYAVTTYTISMSDLLAARIDQVIPRVIATRACFEEGPTKFDELKDVVFPGSLEPLGHEHYRLWVGLSDTRIGTVIVDDPFGIR